MSDNSPLLTADSPLPARRARLALGLRALQVKAGLAALALVAMKYFLAHDPVWFSVGAFTVGLWGVRSALRYRALRRALNLEQDGDRSAMSRTTLAKLAALLVGGALAVYALYTRFWR
jgi:hypothetical protein